MPKLKCYAGHSLQEDLFFEVSIFNTQPVHFLKLISPLLSILDNHTLGNVVILG